jgi:hypothetical protein
LESSGGHGGQEGGEEGACENGTRTPTGCEELEGAEVVACAVAGFQHGAEIFDRINRIDRISEFFDRMSGIAGWTGDLSFKWRWVERELVRCCGGFWDF